MFIFIYKIIFKISVTVFHEASQMHNFSSDQNILKHFKHLM